MEPKNARLKKVPSIRTLSGCRVGKNIEKLSPTSAKSPAHFAWNLQLWVSWVITFDESAMVVTKKNHPPRKMQTQPPKYDLNKAPNQQGA